MRDAPDSHALNVGGAFEIVTALGRIAPAFLAGGLAALAAGGLRTVLLVPAIARIRFVQLTTMAALASPSRHSAAPKLKRPRPRRPLRPPHKNDGPKKTKNGRRRLLKLNRLKKTDGKKKAISNR
jgi:hypothetical protein